MRDLQAYAEFLIDLTLREVGALDALLEVAAANDLPPTAQLVGGQAVRVPVGFVVPPSRRALPHRAPPAPFRASIVADGQSLIDVAIQEYAGVEGLLLLHQLNALPALLSAPASGTALRIDASQASADPTAVALRQRAVRVNTHWRPAAAAATGSQFNESQFNDTQFN